MTKRHYFQLSKYLLGFTQRNDEKRSYFGFRLDFSRSLVDSGLLARAPFLNGGL